MKYCYLIIGLGSCHSDGPSNDSRTDVKTAAVKRVVVERHTILELLAGRTVPSLGVEEGFLPDAFLPYPVPQWMSEKGTDPCLLADDWSGLGCAEKISGPPS